MNIARGNREMWLLDSTLFVERPGVERHEAAAMSASTIAFRRP